MDYRSSSNRLYPLYFFLKAYPKRSIFTVLALLFSGLAEAVSFAAMIPLLGMALRQTDADKELGFLEGAIVEVFEVTGIAISIEAILVFIVSLMGLKSLLSFYAQKEVGYICVDVEADLRKSMVGSLLHADWRYYLENQTGDFSTAISTQVQVATNVFRATGLVLAGAIQVAFF